MKFKTSINLVRRALSLLQKQDQRKIYVVLVIQVLTTLMDMFGIALIGLITSVSLYGIQSIELPASIKEILAILQINNLTLQVQIAVLGLSTGLLLISKTIFSAFIQRKILYFLTIKTAVVTADVLEKVLNQPYDFVKTKSSAELLHTLTRGLSSLLTGVIGAAGIIINEIALLATIFVGVFFFDPIITLVSLFYFGLIAFAQGKKIHTVAESSQNTFTREVINSEAQILEAFNLYRELHVRHARKIQLAHIIETRRKMAHHNVNALFLPYIAKYSLEASLVFGSILLMASQFILKDALNALTTLSIFLVAAGRVSPSLLRLQQGLIQFRSSSGESCKTVELLDNLGNQKVLVEGVSPKSLPSRVSGEIVLRDLSFRYQDSERDTLSKINLTIPSGTLFALIGPSGNGKSTIMDILMGALIPRSGIISIDGIPPNQFIASFPGAIGYVAQESVFSNTSIRDNLLLGLEDHLLSDERILSVLEQVGLLEAVRHLPNGVNSSIGERGLMLSTGQKQRLSFARALITEPKVLFLDEPTSSLDSESEKLITDLIKSLRGKATIVVIAHRLETIESADQVAYVENGQIVKIGTYREVISP